MFKIYLSPSTQEKNIGVLDYGTEENQMNLLCTKIESLLKTLQIESMRNEPDMNLSDVVIESNKYKPNLHLALHSNASSSPLTQGCEVFCHTFTGEGYLFAKNISKYVEGVTPWADRGVKAGKDFYGKGKSIYELEKTNAPAVLIEVDFHTNKNSVIFMQSNINRIAHAIVSGIVDSMALPPKTQIEMELPIKKEDIDYKKKYEDLLYQIEKLVERYKG